MAKSTKLHPGSYLGRTLSSITMHCRRRGIPDKEIAGVVAAISDHYGTPVDQMDGSQLKRLNRDLPPLLTNTILGGQKRVGNDLGLSAAAAAAFGDDG